MIWVYSILITGCVVWLAVIDLRTMLLPNYLTYPLIGLGLCINGLMTLGISQSGFCSFKDSLLGAILGYGLIWSVNALYFRLTKRDGIGMGDAKLLSAMGALFGWMLVLPALLLASILGLFGGIIWIKVFSLKKNSAFPFGPYLCLVTLLVLFDLVAQTHFIQHLFY